jgi:hypothetical protein
MTGRSLRRLKESADGPREVPSLKFAGDEGGESDERPVGAQWTRRYDRSPLRRLEESADGPRDRPSSKFAGDEGGESDERPVRAQWTRPGDRR